MAEKKSNGNWPAIVIFSLIFGGLPGFMAFETENYFTSFLLGFLFSLLLLGGLYTFFGSNE
jgi:hypothetical protein